MQSWLVRLLKGVFIGSGFILPGVSGGALAAVFGLYERMIMFLAGITKNFNTKEFNTEEFNTKDSNTKEFYASEFKENFLFFLPVGLGGLGGVFIFSVFLNFFFQRAEMQLIWFFIGCIVGTLPALWDQAGKRGRGRFHYIVIVVSVLVAIFFLRMASEVAAVPLNIYTWALAGGLIALGMIAPGLSPSNLLLLFGVYEPMTRGIAGFDLFVIIPIGVGGIVTVFAFSRLMAFLFERAYGGLFHAIIGLVVASTILIIPVRYDYFSFSGLVCLGALVVGVLLANWMTKLEERHK